MVSAKHANFIVNTGGATAADVRGLAELVRETVRRERGIELRLRGRVRGRLGRSRGGDMTVSRSAPRPRA